MLGPAQPVKRKFEEVEGPRMASFLEEPQSILNISMCKLRSPPLRKEPSLRRSVLIFNTLRHIERELKRQGVTLPPAPSSGLWQPEDMAMDTLDPPPGCELAGQDQALVANGYSTTCQPLCPPTCPPTPGPQCQTGHHHMPSPYYTTSPSIMCADFHSYSASYMDYSDTPREADHLDTDSSGESSDDSNDGFPDSPVGGDPSSPNPPPPTSSYIDLDSPSNSTTAWSDLLTSSCSGQVQQTSFLVNNGISSSPAGNSVGKWSCATAPTFTTLQTFSAFSSGNLSSGVTSYSSSSSSTISSQQDAFGDIDISMYDFDLATISPTMKQLSPVTAEDLLFSIPPDSSSSSSSSQPCLKTDLLGDDLDHIMQILVGI